MSTCIGTCSATWQAHAYSRRSPSHIKKKKKALLRRNKNQVKDHVFEIYSAEHFAHNAMSNPVYGLQYFWRGRAASFWSPTKFCCFSCCNQSHKEGLRKQGTVQTQLMGVPPYMFPNYLSCATASFKKLSIVNSCIMNASDKVNFCYQW